MGGITLPTRQSLSRRVQAFGSADGRGTGRFRTVRLGDAAADFRLADRSAGLTAAEARHVRDTVDWKAIVALDQNASDSVYEMLNARTTDGQAWPTLRDYMLAHGGVNDVPVIVPIPVTPVPGTTVTPDPANANVITPGMTDAEYRAALVAAQMEALRLQAMQTAKQAANAADSARIKAEDEHARRNAEIESARNADVTPTPKSNAVPWLLAAGLAFLVLKG